MAKKTKKNLEVEALKHNDAKRKNIPTAEFESVMRDEDKTPVRLAYERRNRDLDPQLVWRGKDEQDWSDLVVHAPPLYIQEKLHPRVLIDDLKRETRARAKEAPADMPDLFADFNGLPDLEAKTEFYQHDAHWSNRMILGDSLSVMASLAEREGLRGQVQCIYLDPPYGIKFNSNFQWSTTSRDVKDGSKDHITREPEQVRAFRDTWRDGIHSYLTYLRDRLTVARDLLHESGSIFVQIGDENVHRVRALMDEVFGEDNFVNSIVVKKKSSTLITETVFDYVIWYCRNHEYLKTRNLYDPKDHFSEKSRFGIVVDSKGDRQKFDDPQHSELIRSGQLLLANDDYPLVSQHPHEHRSKPFRFQGEDKRPGSSRQWTFEPDVQLPRLMKAARMRATKNTLRGIVLQSDTSIEPRNNIWNFHGEPNPIYVVQTNRSIVERCILMTTDPGDLVLDPTCGSGTTAYVAEQWGRRWITIDTSRVSLALARSRIMGARYAYYLLADSPEGQRKEGEVTRTPPKTTATRGDIRHGFVYERVPHITLKSIANNAEIDVIWDKWQEVLEPLRAKLNAALGRSPSPLVGEGGAIAPGEGVAAKAPHPPTSSAPSPARGEGKGFEEWEIPREADSKWPAAAIDAHTKWWEARIARQKEIDASIAARAEFEYLYDKPYTDNSRVRVAGPFTVESLSPHRTLAVDWDDELIDILKADEGKRAAPDRGDGMLDFAQMILENLKAAGVQQAHKEDRISFTSLTGWPGHFICAEGVFLEGEKQKRAGIFIGPEFGTVSRPDLVAAAREAGDAGFDVLIACAFNYDAHSAEFDRLGRVPVLKARMNPDLHMGADLKTTSAGNLFVIFGEPDIKIEDAGPDSAGNPMIRVKVFGVDIFKPQTGEVVSEGTDGIALWMLDTDYNEESFFVRHAYFLGANDPYKALKTTLKAEIDQDAWDSLYSDTSRPFPKPSSGRIAVKVINHLGDEVMKVFAVG